MSFADNIKSCHACTYRQRNCHGPCICTADGKRLDIIDHAKSDQCPKGRFGRKENAVAPVITMRYKATRCPRCYGPHAVEACPIPEGYEPEVEAMRTRQGGCCGAPTRPG